MVILLIYCKEKKKKAATHFVTQSHKLNSNESEDDLFGGGVGVGNIFLRLGPMTARFKMISHALSWLKCQFFNSIFCNQRRILNAL